MSKQLSDYGVALLVTAAALGAQSVSAQEAAPAPEAQVAQAAPVEESASSGGIAEIIITATRQEQSLSEVPISVAAFSQEQMDSQGVRAFEDVVRLTPGLNIATGQLRSSLSIRGVASSAGTATTGVYIDDTPIQVRQVGVSSSNVYPTIFDLERVEVLRCPQGTLFGAGSQGGTIRFIQTSPNMTESSLYSRAEYNFNESGGVGYEAGVAGGAPIIDNVLGFRASVFHRREAGWIDKAYGKATVLDSTGRSGADSVAFTPTGVARENTNWIDTTAARLAMTWKPTENLTITPAYSWQEKSAQDFTFNFWPSASDPESSTFVVPQWTPTIDDGHYAMPADVPLNEPMSEKFSIPSLLVEWEIGRATLVSNTSYFTRESDLVSDYTVSHSRSYAARKVPGVGDVGGSHHVNEQDNFTQEVRLQIPFFDDRVNWVGGVFYSRAKQHNLQISYNNFIAAADSIAVAAVTGFPTPEPAVTDGAPFGPGYSAFVNYYGQDLIDGYIQYIADLNSKDEQIAGFTQVDFAVTEKLKVTAGVRVSENENELTPFYDGAITNLNIPQGRACIPPTGAPGGPACIPVEIGEYAPGEGPFADTHVTGVVKGKENAVTPKFGVSYQANPDDLYYATAAKGFRPGGAQQRQPSNCNAQLISLGYVGADGLANPPSSYESDSLWSYEVGSKSRMWDGKLTFDASVYMIKWKDIQSTVSLSSCLQSIYDNLGGATGKGFDMSVQLAPIDPLLLSLSVGYNKTTFDDDTVLGGRTVYTGGSAVPDSGAPWVVVASGEYTIPGAEGRDWYLRGDYTYNSEYEETGSTDPGAVTYDAYMRPRPENYIINTRFGMKTVEGLDVSFFINNLLNDSPELSLSRSNTTAALWTDYTFRPRTMGITVSYRY